MWAPNNRIYFLSDRDRRLNLYSYDLASRQTAQHTHFTDFDIKFPSLGGGADRVRGGRLHLVVRHRGRHRPARADRR